MDKNRNCNHLENETTFGPSLYMHFLLVTYICRVCDFQSIRRTIILEEATNPKEGDEILSFCGNEKASAIRGSVWGC